MSDLFDKLVEVYAKFNIELPKLKGITIAQWWLESGRGTSRLSNDHLNFGGLKWREEMRDYASPVDYLASDGSDIYCRFESLERFINGYWRFIDRSPYKGWRDHAESPEDFIKFIGPIYAGDRNYVSKVLNLYDEAKQLLSNGENLPHIGTGEPVKKPRIKDFIESPNQSSRAGADIDTIVVHYTTAGTFESTKNHFLNPDSEVSAHYVIDKNGDIYQMVKDSEKAWHAVQANRTSIGIEHVAKPGDQLTESQENASVQLIKWLMTQYKIPKENIKAHKEIVGTSCPGNIFGDNIDDERIPKFKAWVARNFSSTRRTTSTPLSPHGLGIYIVQPGDTLSAIAMRHEITLNDLLALNPSIQDPDRVFPGQKITVARVWGDDDAIISTSRALKLKIIISEDQLDPSNYQIFDHPRLGNITITGGYMEPYGHSPKSALKAIFLNGELRTLPPDNDPNEGRNIGIDYVVSDRQVRAWFGGRITKVSQRGDEGGYGRRVHMQLDVTYNFQGKNYQVYQAFAHLQSISVRVGDVIGQGQTLGIMGGSGALSDQDYDLHVDLSTYLFMNGALVQLNPQALDRQLP